MVYIIRKKTNYQDLGNNRIDVGLNYIEERNIDTPKEYALFGAQYLTERGMGICSIAKTK